MFATVVVMVTTTFRRRVLGRHCTGARIGIARDALGGQCSRRVTGGAAEDRT